MKKNLSILNKLDNKIIELEQNKIPIPYSLPLSYFIELPNLIFSEVSLLEISTKAQFAPFEIKTDYFKEFSTSLFDKLKETDICFREKKSILDNSILSEIPKVVVYQVPENYFNNFSIAKIKMASAKSGYVINMFSKRLLTRIVAASIILLIANSSYLIYKNSFNQIGTENLSASNSDINKKINTISDEELAKYLSIDYTLNTDDTANTDDEDNIDNTDFNQNVKVIPDQELNEYLQDIATKQLKTDI